MDEQEKQAMQDTASKEPKEKKDKKEKSSDNPWIFRILRDFFIDLRGELRRIIWPDRKELQKKTITVILTSLLFAAVIFGYDSIYNVILQLFVGLLGGWCYVWWA